MRTVRSFIRAAFNEQKGPVHRFAAYLFVIVIAFVWIQDDYNDDQRERQRDVRTEVEGRASRMLLCEEVNRVKAEILLFLAERYGSPDHPSLQRAKVVFADRDCKAVVKGDPPPPLPSTTPAD